MYSLYIVISIRQKIQALEESKKTNVEKQRRLIGALILYSVLLYAVAALVLYFYSRPASWPDRVLYSSPLAVFPVLLVPSCVCTPRGSGILWFRFCSFVGGRVNLKLMDISRKKILNYY